MLEDGVEKGAIIQEELTQATRENREIRTTRQLFSSLYGIVLGNPFDLAVSRKTVAKAAILELITTEDAKTILKTISAVEKRQKRKVVTYVESSSNNC